MTMSAIRLREFWRSIAALPEDRATWDRWVSVLGDEIEAAKHFLTKKGTAHAVRLQDETGLETRYRVVAHGKTDLVGINDETGERIALTFEAAQMHAVDWGRVVAAFREGLQLSGPHRAIPDLLRTWEVGRCALTDERSVLVYLVGTPRDRMAGTLDRLAETGIQDAVVLVGDTAAVNAEAIARMRARKVLVAGLADTIACDDRRRLVGVAGPESVFGDLRAMLGLAPLERPPYQMIHTGKRCDIVFRAQDIAVDYSVGISAIAQLLGNPNEPRSAAAIQAMTNRVDPRLLAGSKGAKNDRQTRDEVRARITRLSESMQRYGAEHIEYDRWEEELDRLLPMAKDGDGFGGADVQMTTEAAAGRAVGGAITRAIKAIRKTGPAGEALAAHLEDTIKDRTGQHPCYRPSGAAPAWVIAM